MSVPYVGEIRMVGCNFAINGWAFCNGQLMSIAQNDVLFNLIGTTYGGDGVNTFGLPNLQGRFPIHQGNNAGSAYVMGQVSGSETVTLTTNQIPTHNHIVNSSNAGTSDLPSGAYLGAANGTKPYGPAPITSNLNSATVGNSGGGQPHDNMHPYQCINFVISLYGVYPSQN